MKTGEAVAPAPGRVEEKAGPFRVAVLGGGAVTAELYLPAFQTVSGLRLAAVVDPSPEAAARLREAGYSGAMEAASFQSFLDDSKRLEALGLDAVIVALPNALHEMASVR